MLNLIKSKRPPLHIAHRNRQLIVQHEIGALQMQVAQMQKRIAQLQKGDAAGYIQLCIDGRQTLVATKDIVYCQAAGNYSFVWIRQTSDESMPCSRVVVSKSLKTLTALFTDSRFIRCHQSYCINSAYITSVSAENVLLATGDVIPVSRRRRKEVVELLRGDT